MRQGSFDSPEPVAGPWPPLRDLCFKIGGNLYTRRLVKHDESKNSCHKVISHAGKFSWETYLTVVKAQVTSNQQRALTTPQNVPAGLHRCAERSAARMQRIRRRARGMKIVPPVIAGIVNQSFALVVLALLLESGHVHSK